MDIKYIIEIFPQIAAYIPVTLLMAIIAMALALILGGFLTYLSRISYLKWLIDLYLLIFRGFPTIVILFVIYLAYRNS